MLSSFGIDLKELDLGPEASKADLTVAILEIRKKILRKLDASDKPVLTLKQDVSETKDGIKSYFSGSKGEDVDDYKAAKDVIFKFEGKEAGFLRRWNKIILGTDLEADKAKLLALAQALIKDKKLDGDDPDIKKAIALLQPREKNKKGKDGPDVGSLKIEETKDEPTKKSGWKSGESNISSPRPNPVKVGKEREQSQAPDAETVERCKERIVAFFIYEGPNDEAIAKEAADLYNAIWDPNLDQKGLVEIGKRLEFLDDFQSRPGNYANLKL